MKSLLYGVIAIACLFFAWPVFAIILQVIVVGFALVLAFFYSYWVWILCSAIGLIAVSVLVFFWISYLSDKAETKGGKLPVSDGKLPPLPQNPFPLFEPSPDHIQFLDKKSGGGKSPPA